MQTYKVIPPKVLFIEDNNDCWFIIEKVIENGYLIMRPVWVSSCEQALNQFMEWEFQEWELPKLIFLDLYLPQAKDGWKVLKQLKTSSAAIRQIPIVMLSNSSVQEDICKAYQLGAASYIVKPINFVQWIERFTEIRAYWLETVSLPVLRF